MNTLSLQLARLYQRNLGLSTRIEPRVDDTGQTIEEAMSGQNIFLGRGTPLEQNALPTAVPVPQSPLAAPQNPLPVAAKKPTPPGFYDTGTVKRGFEEATRSGATLAERLHGLTEAGTEISSWNPLMPAALVKYARAAETLARDADLPAVAGGASFVRNLLQGFTQRGSRLAPDLLLLGRNAFSADKQAMAPVSAYADVEESLAKADGVANLLGGVGFDIASFFAGAGAAKTALGLLPALARPAAEIPLLGRFIAAFPRAGAAMFGETAADVAAMSAAGAASEVAGNARAYNEGRVSGQNLAMRTAGGAVGGALTSGAPVGGYAAKVATDAGLNMGAAALSNLPGAVMGETPWLGTKNIDDFANSFAGQTALAGVVGGIAPSIIHAAGAIKAKRGGADGSTASAAAGNPPENPPEVGGLHDYQQRQSADYVPPPDDRNYAAEAANFYQKNVNDIFGTKTKRKVAGEHIGVQPDAGGKYVRRDFESAIEDMFAKGMDEEAVKDVFREGFAKAAGINYEPKAKPATTSDFDPSKEIKQPPKGLLPEPNPEEVIAQNAAIEKYVQRSAAAKEAWSDENNLARRAAPEEYKNSSWSDLPDDVKETVVEKIAPKRETQTVRQEAAHFYEPPPKAEPLPEVKTKPRTKAEQRKLDEASVFMTQPGNPAKARAEGQYTLGGEVIKRQEPAKLIADHIGNDAPTRFEGYTDAGKIPTRYVAVPLKSVVAAGDPRHFVPEVQPNARNVQGGEKTQQTELSEAQIWQMARNPDAREMLLGVPAYVGAPTVNARMEIMQGAGRFKALERYYEYYPGDERYISGLTSARVAAEHGIKPEVLRQMWERGEQPVIVRMADVSDEFMSGLGNKKSSDTEVAQSKESRIRGFGNALSDEEARIAAQLLRQGAEGGESLPNLIARNAKELAAALAGTSAARRGALLQDEHAMQEAVTGLLLRGQSQAAVKAFLDEKSGGLLTDSARKALLGGLPAFYANDDGLLRGLLRDSLASWPSAAAAVQAASRKKITSIALDDYYKYLTNERLGGAAPLRDITPESALLTAAIRLPGIHQRLSGFFDSYAGKLRAEEEGMFGGAERIEPSQAAHEAMQEFLDTMRNNNTYRSEAGLREQKREFLDFVRKINDAEQLGYDVREGYFTKDKDGKQHFSTERPGSEPKKPAESGQWPKFKSSSVKLNLAPGSAMAIAAAAIEGDDDQESMIPGITNGTLRRMLMAGAGAALGAGVMASVRAGGRVRPRGAAAMEEGMFGAEETPRLVQLRQLHQTSGYAPRESGIGDFKLSPRDFRPEDYKRLADYAVQYGYADELAGIYEHQLREKNIDLNEYSSFDEMQSKRINSEGAQMITGGAKDLLHAIGDLSTNPMAENSVADISISGGLANLAYRIIDEGGAVRRISAERAIKGVEQVFGKDLEFLRDNPDASSLPGTAAQTRRQAAALLLDGRLGGKLQEREVATIVRNLFGDGSEPDAATITPDEFSSFIAGDGDSPASRFGGHGLLAANAEVRRRLRADIAGKTELTPADVERALRSVNYGVQLQEDGVTGTIIKSVMGKDNLSEIKNAVKDFGGELPLLGGDMIIRQHEDKNFTVEFSERYRRAIIQSLRDDYLPKSNRKEQQEKADAELKTEMLRTEEGRKWLIDHEKRDWLIKNGLLDEGGREELVVDPEFLHADDHTYRLSGEVDENAGDALSVRGANRGEAEYFGNLGQTGFNSRAAFEKWALKQSGRIADKLNMFDAAKGRTSKEEIYDTLADFLNKPWSSLARERVENLSRRIGTDKTLIASNSKALGMAMTYESKGENVVNLHDIFTDVLDGGIRLREHEQFVRRQALLAGITPEEYRSLMKENNGKTNKTAQGQANETQGQQEVLNDAALHGEGAEPGGEAAPAPHIKAVAESVKSGVEALSAAMGKPAKIDFLTPEEASSILADPNKSVQLHIEGKQVKATLAHPDVVNGFYSPLEKRVLEMKADKLPAKQWADKLGGEEAEWTGIKEYLQSLDPKQSVSKAEVQKWLKENRLEILEVHKSGDQAAHGQYVVGGAGAAKENNYKEILIRMPFAQQKLRALRKATAVSFGDYVASKGYASILDVPNGEYRRIESEWQDLHDKQMKSLNMPPEFHGAAAHFPESNIIAHLRMTTRKGANGEKVLFIEEMQSDWAQAGRKHGFDDNDGKSEQPENNLNTWEVIAGLNVNDKVPKAPFVTDTNDWTKLALKVALKEAVAQEADIISWTTGKQQSDRYDGHAAAGMKGYYGDPEAGVSGIIDNVAKKVFGQDPTANNKKYNDLRRRSSEIHDELMKIWMTQDGGHISERESLLSKEYSRLQKEIKEEAKKIMPGKYSFGEENNFIKITDEMRAQVAKGLPLFMKNAEGKTLGFVHKGDDGAYKVFIDPKTTSPETPIHEIAGHVFMPVIEKAQPEFYARGEELIRGTKYEEDVRREYSHLKTDKEVWHEALARAIGERGAKLTSELKKKFGEWLRNMWERISGVLKLKTDADTLSKMTIEDYADLVAGSALHGKNIADRNDGRLFMKLPPAILYGIAAETAMSGIDDEKEYFGFIKGSTLKNIARLGYVGTWKPARNLAGRAALRAMGVMSRSARNAFDNAARDVPSQAREAKHAMLESAGVKKGTPEYRKAMGELPKAWKDARVKESDAQNIADAMTRDGFVRGTKAFDDEFARRGKEFNDFATGANALSRTAAGVQFFINLNHPATRRIQEAAVQAEHYGRDEAGNSKEAWKRFLERKEVVTKRSDDGSAVIKRRETAKEAADSVKKVYRAALDIDWEMSQLRKQKLTENVKEKKRAALEAGIQKKYFAGDEVGFERYKQMREASDHASEEWLRAMAFQRTGIAPWEQPKAFGEVRKLKGVFEGGMKSLRDKLAMAQLSKAWSEVDDIKDEITSLSANYRILTKQIKQIDLFERIIKDSKAYHYLPRWFDKTGRFIARIKDSDGNVVSRNVFDSAAEREAWRKKLTLDKGERYEASERPPSDRMHSSGRFAKRATLGFADELTKRIFRTGGGEVFGTGKGRRDRAAEFFQTIPEWKDLDTNDQNALLDRLMRARMTPENVRAIIYDIWTRPLPNLIARRNIKGYEPDTEDVFRWGQEGFFNMLNKARQITENEALLKAIHQTTDDMSAKGYHDNPMYHYLQDLEGRVAGNPYGNTKPRTVKIAKNIQRTLGMSALALNVSHFLKNIFAGTAASLGELTATARGNEMTAGLRGAMDFARGTMTLPLAAVQKRAATDSRYGELYRALTHLDIQEAQYVRQFGSGGDTHLSARKYSPDRMLAASSDKLMVLTRASEAANNLIAGMAAGERILASGGSMDEAIKFALEMRNRTQGRFVPWARSKAETWLNQKTGGIGIVGQTLLSAQFRATEHFASLIARGLVGTYNPKTGAWDKRTAGAATLALSALALGGVAAVPFIADINKIADYIEHFFDDEKEPRAVRENSEERHRRQIGTLAERQGYSRAAGEAVYDNFKYGIPAMMANKNFSSDASLVGALEPIALTKAQELLKVGKTIVNDPGAHTLIAAANFASTTGGRAMQAAQQLTEGQSMDKKGNYRGRPYGWTDALAQTALGQDMTDIRATSARFAGGGGIYDNVDKRQFATALDRLPGLVLPKSDGTRDNIAANAENVRRLLIENYEGTEPARRREIEQLGSALNAHKKEVAQLALQGESAAGSRKEPALLQTQLEAAVNNWYAAQAAIEALRRMGYPARWNGEATGFDQAMKIYEEKKKKGRQ